MHSTRRHPALLGMTVALLVVLSGFGLVFGRADAQLPPTIEHSVLAQSGSTLNATLRAQTTATVLNQSFWGTTLSARSPFFANESALIAAAGTRVLLWPGAWAGDDYDPFNNQLYSSSTHYRTAPTTEAQFVAYCKSINCTAIMELPGEMNNASFAARVVQYTEQNLSFTPALWEIGNEPGLWGHWTPYSATWANWTGYTHAPSAVQYAAEEWNYTQAVDKVDPGFKFVGIPGVGPGGVLYNWINATIALNGPNISGMAVHVYPDVTGSNNTLATFYHFLNVSNYDSIPGREGNLENWIHEALSYSPSCKVYSCGSMPVMYTEMGSAISGRPDGLHYSEGFAGALFMAAEFTQAFAANITTVEAYAAVLDTVNSWYSVSGEPHPLYTLYTGVLSHLGPDVYPATLTVNGDPSVSGNLYATETVAPAAGGREDLLVVNLNQLNNVSFAPALPGYTEGTPVEVWEWNSTNTTGLSGNDIAPAAPGPTPQFFPGGLPSTWTIPEQSVALFEALPGGGAPAVFTETGLPGGTRWWVGVDNTTGTSSTPTITFFLRPGEYTTVPGPVFGVPGHLKTERFAPRPSMEFALPPGGVNLSIPYLLQYSLNLTVSPAGSGTIGPPTSWANANSTVQLTASPNPGFGFVAWYGEGNGSYNGSTNPAALTVLEPLHETAIFGVGYTVSFVESGLSAGTPWSVTLRGASLAGNGAALVAAEPNGTYAFQVPNVTGYTVQPVSSFIDVNGSPLVVPVTFKAIPILYSVTFTESGLVPGRGWSVTIRNTTYYRSTPSLFLPEYDGTYGFLVANETGYTVHPTSSFFTVAGYDVTVSVDFTLIPIYYPIVWEESGLPNGTRWSVTVRSEEINTTGTEVELLEANGTYTYQFGNVTGYRASPPLGGFSVAGAGITLGVRWVPLPPPSYFVTFSAGSLATGGIWSVSFAGLNASTAKSTLTFSVSNGTFHYAVTPPAGHYVTPGGGTVVVAGTPQTIGLSFGLPAPPLPPSEWTELSRALAVVGMLALVGVVTFLVFSRRDRRERAEAAAALSSRAPVYLEESEPALGSHVAPDYHEDALPR